MAVSKWLSVAAAVAPTALAMTPAQLITAPRRGEAIPNPSGDLALFQLTQYSFEKHDTVKTEWNLLDLETGDSKVLTDDPNVSEIVWLGAENTSVLYINATNSAGDGGVSLWTSDVEEFGISRSLVGDLSAPLGGLKAVITEEGDVNFVVYGDSTADGEPYNPDQAAAPLSSARIYDSIYVRHWDYYLTPEYQAVFSGKLTQDDSPAGFSFDGELTNLVAPVEYAESPYPPFGGASDYDLSPDGQTVAFMSKAPEIPKANYTTSYIYVVPHDGSEKAFALNEVDGPTTPEGIRGASSAPVFSPDSKQIAYLQMEEEDYESDRRIIYVSSLGLDEPIRSVASKWDRSPEAVKWTPDGETFYIVVEDAGRGPLFSVPVNASAEYKPQKFTTDGYVSAFHFLGDSDSVLATSSAIWSSAIFTIANPKEEPNTIFSANEVDPELSGFGPHDVDEFYTAGNWTDIHSWIVKPEGFSEDKTYPLAFLIHGGPQGSWADSWSTRWNPKVWADQGYVVVTPNPTGSTGFGEELTDAIQNDWGGAPYDDLVKTWEYIRDNIPYIDTDNGVAAGASYGGFMVNWIQGNDLGREFKALVSHDGTFVAEAKIGTEELFFMQHDFNGTFWEARENYERFDPAAVDNILAFATPQLVIHNDLDYRLPVSEGLALFNILQLRGVPSRFLNFPDENHWVVGEENSLVWHQQSLGWINKYSGVAETNPDAVQLSDTVVPVVKIDP
ncbi:putative dipeptidyl-peptidase 5 [Arachnomyces sp. PD_36]|nr:putative dipeptidyl-peptidase 5 [Arachnomyces sp. PD_36]